MSFPVDPLCPNSRLQALKAILQKAEKFGTSGLLDGSAPTRKIETEVKWPDQKQTESTA